MRKGFYMIRHDNLWLLEFMPACHQDDVIGAPPVPSFYVYLTAIQTSKAALYFLVLYFSDPYVLET